MSALTVPGSRCSTPGVSASSPGGLFRGSASWRCAVWFFRAVALDLDGTLTEDDQLTESGMAAIKADRAGRRAPACIWSMPPRTCRPPPTCWRSRAQGGPAWFSTCRACRRAASPRTWTGCPPLSRPSVLSTASRTGSSPTKRTLLGMPARSSRAGQASPSPAPASPRGGRIPCPPPPVAPWTSPSPRPECPPPQAAHPLRRPAPPYRSADSHRGRSPSPSASAHTYATSHPDQKATLGCCWAASAG